MEAILWIVGYVLAGYVVGSISERQRRKARARCGRYYREDVHFFHNEAAPWFAFFLWPLALVGTALFFIIKSLSFLSPIRGANAIDSVATEAQRRVEEIKKKAEERRKSLVLVEGKGEDDAA